MIDMIDMDTPIDTCLCGFCGKAKRSSALCKCGEKPLYTTVCVNMKKAYMETIDDLSKAISYTAWYRFSRRFELQSQLSKYEAKVSKLDV